MWASSCLPTSGPYPGLPHVMELLCLGVKQTPSSGCWGPALPSWETALANLLPQHCPISPHFLSPRVTLFILSPLQPPSPPTSLLPFTMLAPPPLLPASLESPHSPVWPSQSQGHQRNSFRPAPRCPSSEAQWAALSARSEAAAVGSTLAAPSSLTHCVLQAHRPIAAPTGCPVGPVSPVP